MSDDPSSPPLIYKRLKEAAIVASVSAAFVLTSLFLIPLSPLMPTAGLDSSWQYAVNEAVARHLVFGRDFIFTFGPLASVYTEMYHPQTDHIMLLGSLLEACSLSCGFLILMGRKRVFLIILLPLIIAESGFRDAFLMIMPLLLVLVVFRISTRLEGVNPVPITPLNALGIACLTCGVAVLPLIKGSFAGMAFIEGAITLLIAVRGRRLGLAVALCCLAVGMLCGAWILTGQPIGALPGFFIAQAPIISGYSEAMSLHGRFSDVIGWLLAATVCLAIFYFSLARKSGFSGGLITLAFVFYLFVVFKAGFVRQDGHTRIAGDSLLFVALVFLGFLRFRSAIVIAAVAILDWSAIEMTIEPFNLQVAYDRAYDALAGLPAKVGLRVHDDSHLNILVEQANFSIRTQYPLPVVSGTADIYPSNLAALLASGIPWSGRPIPQSYSAYTSSLSALNAAHLASSNAPKNVFFSISPIDGRLPALEDSMSWPELLTLYKAVSVDQDFIQMTRRDFPADPPRYGEAYRSVAEINHDIALPRLNNAIWATVDLKPTLIGRIALALFRLPQVHIEVTLDDDTKILHRFIPEMAESGFLLSPYVENGNQFVALTWGRSTQRAVKSIKLIAGGGFLWKTKFDVSFRSVVFASDSDTKKLIVLEALPSFQLDAPVSQGADCAVDYIDGRLLKAPSGDIKIGADYFSIQGWAAPSGKQGIGPNKIIVSLADDLGHIRYYAPTIQQRIDVKAYFGHPEMANPGFAASFDTSGLSGRQKLSIYALGSQGVFACPKMPDLVVQ